MESHIKLVVVMCAVSLVSICGAQERGAATAVSAGELRDANNVAFPYVAEITADDVYIRSGPGTEHYTCGKLNKNDRVTVIGSHFGWSQTVPPAGSFSWISARYVKVDVNDREKGIVTGDSVRVYVGADGRDPLESTRTQLQLNRGDKVRLLGELKSDYYKIEPPSGAYRWVSTGYTKPVGPVLDITVPPSVGVQPGDTNTMVVGTTLPVEAGRLQEYYAIAARIDAERAKPIAEQNYAGIKQSLQAIAGDNQAGKAAKYAQFALKQIERCELVLDVAKVVRLQDADLRNRKEQIEQARAARLADLKNLGRFAVIGEFQTFAAYGRGHYRVVDRTSKKTLCYAVAAAEADLSKFIGRKVGLIGTIEPHLETAGAMVRFTEVVEVE